MNVGIIGAGKIAERHIAAYKKIDGAIPIISDIDKDCAKNVSDCFEIEFTASAEELILSKDIQVIDVCTPVISHKDIILSALHHGKHVFCEKPLCSTLYEAYQIKGAAENSEKLLMVGYLYRFHPAFVKVKEWLDERLIGNPYFGIFRIGGRGNHQAWKHSLKHGGGAINEMLIHKLDLILWYMGEAQDVTVYSKDIILPEREINGQKIGADVEDLVVAEFQCNGTKIICEADFITPSYMEYLEIQGDNGSIFTSLLNHFPTILFLKKATGIYNQGNNFFNFAQTNLFELEIEHFFDCIQNGKRNMNSIDDSISILQNVEKIRGFK